MEKYCGVAKRRFALLMMAGVMASPGRAAGSDSVVAMCLQTSAAAAACHCAAEKLRAAIGDEAYLSYERVGAVYLRALTTTPDRGAAWSGALKVEGMQQNAANDYGRAHRDAIRACGA